MLTQEVEGYLDNDAVVYGATQIFDALSDFTRFQILSALRAAGGMPRLAVGHLAPASDAARPRASDAASRGAAKDVHALR